MAVSNGMRVNALDHVNIRTRDLEASARFYADLLGLAMRDPPAPVTPAQARWLCDAEGRPIIHLRAFDSEPGPTGPIDHVALNCSGKAELVARLEARGAQFQVYDGLPGLTQVFTKDPHGVLLELNFYSD